MTEITTTQRVWCENVNAPAHGNGAHERQDNCRNPRTVETEFTGVYVVEQVHTSRSSHNGLLVLTGGKLEGSRVYCDTRIQGFATLETGKMWHFTFNGNFDITEIRPVCEGCSEAVSKIGEICEPCRNGVW